MRFIGADCDKICVENPVGFFIAPIESAKSAQVCKAWNDKGLGWVTDNLGDSKLNGYVNICFYFGSSTYDTEQMSRLIDLLITE